MNELIQQARELCEEADKVNPSDVFGGLNEFAQDCRNGVAELLKSQPTVDAVEVVRCKDCKHKGTWYCHMEYDEYHPEADIHHEMHGDDDFCSYGERKDGDRIDE